MNRLSPDQRPSPSNRLVEDGQFGLFSIFVVVGFAGFLFAMLSQRSPWGVIAWSVAGAVFSGFVRSRYLRRSLFCLFFGTVLLAFCMLHLFGPSIETDFVSVLSGLGGVMLMISGGIATLANLARAGRNDTSE